MYLALGQLGISALDSYQPESKKWTSAHDRARFGIMRTLMAANGFMTVSFDEDNYPTVRIDRARLLDSARPSIQTLMTKLHMWRCGADGVSATDFYGKLTDVDVFWLRVRDPVVDKVKNQTPRVFVQANTVLEKNENENGRVRVLEYDTTVQGVIQSWCEREVYETCFWKQCHSTLLTTT